MDSKLHLQVSEEFDPAIPPILPHSKVYLIQVGYKVFRLSGASLLSDAPSYFTAYFSRPENADSILFIDRNPNVFELIYHHLQGYHINIETDYQFVHLWLDSYYFCLKRLQKLLDEEDVFASIGGKSFKIPRALFVRTGNYPNYFLMSYDSLLTDNRKIIDERSMIRPPPQRPATAATRSPILFAEIIELLRGNHSVIGNDEHRKLLVKECRYFRLLELEQRLVKYKLVFNPFLKLVEIMLNVNDILSRGIVNVSTGTQDERCIEYARPNISNEPQRPLLVQLESTAESEVRLILNRSTQITTLFITNKLAHTFNQVFKKVSSDLYDDSAPNRVVLLAGLSRSKVVMNGRELKLDWFVDFFSQATSEEPLAKKQKSDASTLEGDYVEFHLSRSVWRFLTRGDKVRLHAVNLEGHAAIEFYAEGVNFL